MGLPSYCVSKGVYACSIRLGQQPEQDRSLSLRRLTRRRCLPGLALLVPALLIFVGNFFIGVHSVVSASPSSACTATSPGSEPGCLSGPYWACRSSPCILARHAIQSESACACLFYYVG